MQQVPSIASTSQDRDLVFALQLIAHGSADEKVQFIARRDPDLFVDQVLDWGVDYVDRDGSAPRRQPVDRAVLDAVIARIALGTESSAPELRASA